MILLKTLNQRSGLVNGARGVVEGFEGSGATLAPRVRFTNGVVQRIPRAPMPSRQTVLTNNLLETTIVES